MAIVIANTGAAPFGTYAVTLVNERTSRVYTRDVIAESEARAAAAAHAATGHAVLDVAEIGADR